MKSLKKTLISLVGVSALSFSLAMPAMATYNLPTVNDCTSGLINIVAVVPVLVGSVLVPINAPIKVYDINLFNDSDINVLNGVLSNTKVEDINVLQNAFACAKFLNGLNVITGNDVLTNSGYSSVDVVSVYKSLDGVIVFVKKAH